MLKNITRTLSLSLLVVNSVSANDAPSNKQQLTPQLTDQMLNKFGAGFTSLEHKNIGDLVRLHLTAQSSGEVIQLSLPNGLKLSYGDIVMLAGDVFGNPYKTISSCPEQKRLECFKAQFSSMAIQGNEQDKRCENPHTQVKAIKAYLSEIENEIKKSRAKGVQDWVYYSKHDVDISKKMNKLTCGGSFISSFFPFGGYIKLAQENFDHFAPDSLVAYKAGHQYALETAREGYKKEKIGLHEEAQKLLELAYAQNAFANHYLTDSFSAGHMRTPRREINRQISLPSVLNLLIANLMHNEDNRNGLNVVNAEGSSWFAYGDGYLYKPEAQLQKTIMLDAMQRSADAIYSVYLTGAIPGVFSEMALFPDYEKIPQLNDSSPLFKVENGVLLKRVNHDNYHDTNWTRYWSGLYTLIRFTVK